MSLYNNIWMIHIIQNKYVFMLPMCYFHATRYATPVFHGLFKSAHEILVLILLASSRGFDKPAYMHSLSRAFIHCKNYKQVYDTSRWKS